METTMKLGSRLRVLGAMATIALGLLSSASAYGQAAPARQLMSEQAFKNVTALKGIPVDEFMDTMGFISASLGLNCLDCHTPDADQAWTKFAIDTPMKVTSRKMIQMVA